MKRKTASDKPPKVTQVPALFSIRPYVPERVTRRPGSYDFERLPSRAGEKTIAFKPGL
jgi:hypothetical protein